MRAIQKTSKMMKLSILCLFFVNIEVYAQVDVLLLKLVGYCHKTIMPVTLSDDMLRSNFNRAYTMIDSFNPGDVNLTIIDSSLFEEIIIRFKEILNKNNDISASLEDCPKYLCLFINSNDKVDTITINNKLSLITVFGEFRNYLCSLNKPETMNYIEDLTLVLMRFDSAIKIENPCNN